MFDTIPELKEELESLWDAYMSDKVLDIWTVEDVCELADSDGLDISEVDSLTIKNILDYVLAESDGQYGITWPLIKSQLYKIRYI